MASAFHGWAKFGMMSADGSFLINILILQYEK
jgi:hypothetical protein